MSKARAYMMVYLLSVVSVYRLVLVVDFEKRGDSVYSPIAERAVIVVRLMLVVGDVLPTRGITKQAMFSSLRNCNVK
jgi:hypothetical protein